MLVMNRITGRYQDNLFRNLPSFLQDGDLLILNDTLPRSLASCYGNLVRNLDQIGVAYGRQGAAQRHARGVRHRLEHSHMDDIFQHGVHEFIQEFIADNSRLGEIITKQYLI